MSVLDSERQNMTEIEGVLNELGRCALAKIPAMVKLSLKELAEIPWVAAELETINKDEGENDEKVSEEENMEYVVIRDLDEAFTVKKDDIENDKWVKRIIEKALRTKPIDATHLILYTP